MNGPLGQGSGDCNTLFLVCFISRWKQRDVLTRRRTSSIWVQSDAGVPAPRCAGSQMRAAPLYIWNADAGSRCVVWYKLTRLDCNTLLTGVCCNLLGGTACVKREERVKAGGRLWTWWKCGLHHRPLRATCSDCTCRHEVGKQRNQLRGSPRSRQSNV